MVPSWGGAGGCPDVEPSVSVSVRVAASGPAARPAKVVTGIGPVDPDLTWAGIGRASGVGSAARD